MKGFIYLYTFPDGKVYIGQTRRPIVARHKEHLNPSTGPLNAGFWEAYQALGEPELTILETVEAEDVTSLVELLNHKETFYIQQADATNPQFGYNRRASATAYSPDNTILEKEMCRLRHQAQESVRVFVETVANKIITGHQSDLTNEESNFIRSRLLDNNLFSQALREIMNPEDLSIREGADLFWLEEAMDYASFSYLDDNEESIRHFVADNTEAILHEGKRGKIIQQLDKDGKVVREYVTKEQICEAFNIIRIDNITNVLKEKQKTAYGFFWRYKPE